MVTDILEIMKCFRSVHNVLSLRDLTTDWRCPWVQFLEFLGCKKPEWNLLCLEKKTQSRRRRRRSRLHWPGKEEDTVESQDYYRSKVWVQIRSVKQNMRKIILFYLPNWGFWIRFGPTEVEKFVLSKLVQNRISIIIIRFRPNTHKPLFGRPLDVEGETGPTLLMGGWPSNRTTELVSQDGSSSSANFTLKYDTE